MKPGLSRTTTRAALMENLEHAVRKSSAQGLIFSQTVADRAGVSNTDMECMDFVNVEGRMTAGRLAELTGLTTGAITGVIDRMEKAGLVRRERDPKDRRKVYIVPEPERLVQIGRYYLPLQRDMQALWDTYSDAELKLLLRFTKESYEVMVGATSDLRAVIESSKKASPATRTRRGSKAGAD